MTKELKKISGSKVQFKLKIESEDIQRMHNVTLEELKKDVAVKGFRKGHAPDNMVIASVGIDRFSQEVMQRALDKKYLAFVRENDLAVINRPEVVFPEKQEMPMEVTFTVEVYPEVKLGDYNKIKTTAFEDKTEESEIDDVLMTVMSQMGMGNKVDDKVKKGSLVLGSFAGFDDKGNELPNTKGENQSFRIGMGHFLEDLEKGFMGMKAEESKEKVMVSFPKDYHAPDMAGKKVAFNISVEEVKELDPKKLTDADAESISGQKQSVEDLRNMIRDNISQNKKQKHVNEETQKFTDELAKLIKVEMPQSWIDREVSSRLEKLKSSPQYQKAPDLFWKTAGKDEEAFKKEIADQGEKELKVYLGLKEIVVAEAVELDKDEMSQVAVQLKNTFEEGSDNYHAEKERLELNMKIDKFLKSKV